MISKLLSKVGLPLLLKFIVSALGNINSNLSKEASLSLLKVTDSLSSEELKFDEGKLKEIELGLDEKTLSNIHQTIREELKSEDRFVRFWRPLFGYSVAIAWFINIATVCCIVLADKPNAADLILALAETTPLWSVALGVLGVSVVKNNQEKQK